MMVDVDTNHYSMGNTMQQEEASLGGGRLCPGLAVGNVRLRQRQRPGVLPRPQQLPRLLLRGHRHVHPHLLAPSGFRIRV